MRLAWTTYPEKDMAVTFYYSSLEYQLIKLVAPRKKAQITLKSPQELPQTAI